MIFHELIMYYASLPTYIIKKNLKNGLLKIILYFHNERLAYQIFPFTFQ